MKIRLLTTQSVTDHLIDDANIVASEPPWLVLGSLVRLVLVPVLVRLDDDPVVVVVDDAFDATQQRLRLQEVAHLPEQRVQRHRLRGNHFTSKKDLPNMQIARLRSRVCCDPSLIMITSSSSAPTTKLPFSRRAGEEEALANPNRFSIMKEKKKYKKKKF